MFNLDWLGPAADIFREGTDKLDKRFCEVKSVLHDIRENTRASMYRNNWTHASIIPESGQTFGVLRNDTGSGWLVHWMVNASSEKEPKVWLGSENQTRLLATMGKLEAGEVRFYIPPFTDILVTNIEKSCVNIQYELVPVKPKSADGGKSNEATTIHKMVDTRPTADIREIYTAEGVPRG